MLSDDALQLYARQVVIKNIGEGGQARLMQTRVAMIGVGGIAGHLLPLLVGSGIKKITLCDDDVVEKSNLHRQLMFRKPDIGKPKVLAAQSFLQAMADDVAITCHEKKILTMGDAAMLADHDILLEGSDNVECKLLADNIARAIKKPIIIGGATGYDGQVGFFYGDKKRYGDIFQAGAPADVAHCATAGILNSTLAQVAGLMAQLLFDYIFNQSEDAKFFLLNNGKELQEIAL